MISHNIMITIISPMPFPIIYKNMDRPQMQAAFKSNAPDLSER
ncbi:MAG: hypothetical protein RHS_1074 [Robinsoniella sp. RHS]|nr:MAG: hypothetical protein RHS_1074 [Robinsoniella sp. RHS]